MTTTGKTRRRLSADEELTILEEARQPNTTVAEVLRRHQLDATTFSGAPPSSFASPPFAHSPMLLEATGISR